MSSSDYRRIARERLDGNWIPAIAVTFVAVLLGGAVTSGSFNFEIDEELLYYLPDFVIVIITILAGFGTALSLAQTILGGTVQLGYAQYLLNQHDNVRRGFEDLFSQFYRFKDGFCQAFLRGLYVFLWSLLLIVPGIVAGYSYSMTPFIMADYPEMTASEAIAASKELMKGHKLDLFCLDLTFIGWTVLCGLTLGLGFVVLNPYMNAAHAAFYRDITTPGHEDEDESMYEYEYTA